MLALLLHVAVLQQTVQSLGTGLQQFTSGEKPVIDVDTDTYTPKKPPTIDSRRQQDYRRQQNPRLHNSCGLRIFTTTFNLRNCTRLVARGTGCLGTCVSYAISSTLRDGNYKSRSHRTLRTNCNCCRPVGIRQKFYDIDCSLDKVSRKRRVTLEVATGCRCRPC